MGILAVLPVSVRLPGNVGAPFVKDGAVFQNPVGIGLGRSGGAAQFHIRLVGRAPRLGQVAALAGGHHIVPGIGAVVPARHHMVQGKPLRLDAAVLAGVMVPQKHLFFGQASGRERPLDQINQPDDRRRVQRGAETADARRFGTLFQQLGLAFGQQDNGPAHGADIHRHIVEVQHQHRSGKASRHENAGAAGRRR